MIGVTLRSRKEYQIEAGPGWINVKNRRDQRGPQILEDGAESLSIIQLKRSSEWR